MKFNVISGEVEGTPQELATIIQGFTKPKVAPSPSIERPSKVEVIPSITKPKRKITPTAKAGKVGLLADPQLVRTILHTNEHKLSHDQYQVVCLRFGFYGRPALTIPQTAIALGIPQETVRRLFKEALTNLNVPFTFRLTGNAKKQHEARLGKLSLVNT